MEMESGVGLGTTGYKSSILSGFEPAISLYLCATLPQNIDGGYFEVPNPNYISRNQCCKRFVYFYFVLTTTIFQKLIRKTYELLKEGSLVRDNILDHVNKVTNLIRECNVTLRWLMLHTATNHSSEKSIFLPS